MSLFPSAGPVFAVESSQDSSSSPVASVALKSFFPSAGPVFAVESELTTRSVASVALMSLFPSAGPVFAVESESDLQVLLPQWR